MSRKKYLLLFITLIILISLISFPNFLKAPDEKFLKEEVKNEINQNPEFSDKFSSPISNPLQRITKKSFGTYVTPQNSPINPEKFTGYHTGVDFEIFSSEEDVRVPIYAICDGTVVVKKVASGYGGVTVLQCSLNNSPITVIYGHLELSSVKNVVGDKIKQGEIIGNLGKAYSIETSGERKHLHLGIYKGSKINILGYTQNKNDLTNWINVEDYLNR